MKIWFDLSNSPHINLFSAMIKELMLEHEVVITCRPLANTVDLLDLHGFRYAIVGKHYGKKLSSKLFGYPLRVRELVKFLKNKKIDVGITQSTFTSSIAARFAGIPFIYMNDNEHALGNIPSFIFANRILIPEFLDRKKVLKQGARNSKIIQYPGVKEGIYLWNAPVNHKELIEKVIYVRPEPWTAQYYKGALNFMDDMILYLRDRSRVIILPRSKDQAIHYDQDKFRGVDVLNKPLNLEEIASQCRLFIGAGGTMTREMAVLGIPTISVYQDELLEVDKYLINKGIMLHKPDLTGEFAFNYMQTCEQKDPNVDLLRRGKEAYYLIINLLIHKISDIPK